eukprot:TRINITY_DN6283_c0_g1_i1.p1 TRINITY_DN6283_c0_g1~~TRINITY_DN6283_c0_g1_i1.p1  ORF type:complete len:687 (+),score=144.02 TRINITY_DN6283_c0_g1_i1:108-2168(+)
MKPGLHQIYQATFEPPVRLIDYPHLSSPFTGFHIFIYDTVVVPSFVLVKKRQTQTVNIGHEGSGDLDEDDIQLLTRFKSFLFQRIFKKPLDLEKCDQMLFTPSFVGDDVLNGRKELFSKVEELLSLTEVDPIVKKIKGEGDWIQENATDLRKVVNGRIGITPYNEISYIIRDVDFKRNPLSSLTTKNNQTSTFQEYYLQKRGITIADVTQPLLVEGSVPRRDFEPISDDWQLPNRSARGKGRDCAIIPELTVICGITYEMFIFARFLTLIWYHIQVYIKMDKFEASIGFQFENKKLLKQAFSHPSFSNEHHGSLTNYQRLEFVGDSVLDFMVSVKLYQMFPKASEGRLSYLKSCLVNNHFLSFLGRHIHLDKYTIMSPHFTTTPSEKTTADVFEALIGLLYLTKGFPAVEWFYDNALFMERTSYSDFWKFCFPTEENKMAVDDDLIQLYGQVEDIIGVVFQDKSLLVQAFTHSSYARLKNTKNYERMELLGDAILELIASLYLFNEYPTATEGELSMCRSQIVNNQTLAECIQYLGLHQFLRHASPHLTFNGPRLQKTYADLFESLLGAIFLDHGLQSCFHFVQTFLIKRSKVNPDQIILDPKSLFQHLLQNEGLPTPQYKVETKTKTLYGDIYEVGVYSQGQLKVKAEGQTLRESQRIAAQKAIQLHLSVDRYMDIQNNGQQSDQ